MRQLLHRCSFQSAHAVGASQRNLPPFPDTGSAALATQLTQLEREKELLDVQIQEEERG